MSSSPRRCGISGSGVDSTELGPNRLGERNRVGRSRAAQLSAGTAGPAPAAPPPPERLPAAAGGAAAAAEARPGCTLGEGTNGYRRSFLRARARPPSSPAPRHPFLSPPGPGLREEGAGGGRRRPAEEEKESKERSVPGEKPAPAAAESPPSFPPRKCGDGGGSCERKRRFSSATRRSYTARHEQEETAPARRLLGQ